MTTDFTADSSAASLDAAAVPAVGYQWPPPGGDSIRRPMPHLSDDRVCKAFVRGTLWLNRKKLRVLSGLEHIGIDKDPFIVVANHSQRVEAMLLPALLFYQRDGKRVHFLADWPMMLLPGVGLMYRAAQVIPVFGKSAKPAFLNSLKRFYEKPGTAWERASQRLAEGNSVGVFPEGTVNRDPKRLLRGRLGAAQLAIDNNTPVVPVGIRFPQHQDAESIPDGAPMDVEIGAPLTPPEGEGDSKELVRDFQVRIMESLSRLSGKEWTPGAPRRKNRWA